MKLKNYFNIRKLFKSIGLLLILLGLSDGFIDSLTSAQAEDYLHIGMAVLAITFMFTSSSEKTEELSPNMGSDSVVKGDEIWEPIASEGSSFYTQRLVRYANGLIKVRPTVKQILFNLRFILSGLFALLVAFALFVILENYISILPAVIGGTFLWFGVNNMRQREIVIFDLNTAQLSKKEEEGSIVIPFSQIHGLQLMEVYYGTSKIYSNSSDNYYVYELNLILKNSNRVNIMSHGDKNEMIKDAKMLAAYLSVPIWHKL